MEENSNLSKTEAREEVSEMMLPKDRNLLLKKYTRIFIIFVQLNQSKLHRDIQKEVSTLMEKRDIDLERAISRVLNKHRQEFDQLLEADNSFYEDNIREESGDEEMDE